MLFPLAEAVGPTGRVTGVDLSARMVELCAAEAATRGLNHVRVATGDAAAPAFPPGSFDVVTAGMVMFFVPAPRAAVRHVAGLLRPGGVFAMSSFGPSDPKFTETMAILYRHRVGPPWEEATDKPFDSAASIAAMLSEAGYAAVDVGETAHEIVLSSLDQYWGWVASHGGRILIDAVGPERLPAAKTEVLAMLRGHQNADGSSWSTGRSRAMIARRPDMSSVQIRDAVIDDWPDIWSFAGPILAAGETYAVDRDITAERACRWWMVVPPGRAFVAVLEGRVVGTARLGRNHDGGGAHVANASFLVDPAVSGRGIGQTLGEHVLAAARAAGFRAMQFNAVVETNAAAVRLWTSLGFAILTTVPEAFDHPRHGLVGLHVMHRRLD